MRAEIEAIKERNQRVEADKAWETSKVRKLLIAVATYILVVVFLMAIGVSNPFLGALVPVIGYLLSTISFPFVKKWWIDHYYQK